MKLYVSDLDGTLFSNFEGFNEESRGHLRRLMDKGGARFTFATARVVPSGLQALGNPPIKEPMIGCGGAVVQHPDGTVLYENLLEPARVSEGVALFKKLGLGMTLILSPSQRHERRWWTPEGFKLMDSFIASHWTDSSFVALNGEDPEKLPVVGLSCCGPEEALAPVREWALLHPTLRLEIVEDPYQKGVFVGFVQDDRASKGGALRLLCDHLGLPLEEVTVFGDAMNDLSMFELPCRKVAVHLAIPEIKRLADIVLADGDSVLHFIERELAG